MNSAGVTPIGAIISRHPERQHHQHLRQSQPVESNASHPRQSSESSPLLGLKQHTLEAQMDEEDILETAENVYSYHMIVVPQEQRHARDHRCSWIVIYACGLVLLNLLMQFCLLAMVSYTVLSRNTALVESLLQHGASAPPHDRLRAMLYSEEPQTQCRSSASLCFDNGAGGITCAPPSVQILQHWHLLDTDGNGVWSRDEAANPEFREEVQCKYNVDILTLFDDIAGDLRNQPSLRGRLHPDLVDGMHVHKAYFDWFIGEPLLCQYGDQDMCGLLFARGIFDGALRSGGNASAASERGIRDVQTARDYCTNLLQYRCDSLLPSTYRVWKVYSVEKCGSKNFSPFKYEPPGGGPDQWMLQVRFVQQDEYTKASTWQFQCFLAVLLFIFLTVMLEEIKGISQTYKWVIWYPLVEDEEVETAHRINVLMINLVRTFFCVILLYSGSLFLTEDTDYLNLIFDALSLVFIIQVDEILYTTLLRKQMKDSHKDLEGINMPMTPNPFCSVMFREIVKVVFVLGVTFCICANYLLFTVRPLHEALECLCTVEGPHCREAHVYQASWWTEYWTQTLPRASAEIDDLMLKSRSIWPAGVSGFGALPQTVPG